MISVQRRFHAVRVEGALRRRHHHVLARPALRPDRPERRRQVHVHEAADRRAHAASAAPWSGRQKLGVLRQDQFAFDEFRVIDTVIMGNAPAVGRRSRSASSSTRKPDMTDDDGMRLGELEGIVGEEDGYTAESDAAILLQGLDIPDELHERTMGELQGGQKVRVLLAQALFGQPAGAAARRADEPPRPRLDPLAARVPRAIRRHADRHLARPAFPQRGLHAHRRHRLPDDHHLHRRLRRHGAWPRRRSARGIESDNAQREKKIAQLNDFIARFSAGTRSSQVQSRRKEVERLQTTELARSNIQRPYIKFQMNRPSGRTAIEFKDVSKAYGEQHVVSSFSAIVNRGEKIVLVGRNGAGKTTLLKALLADAPNLPPSPGDIDAGRCAGATRCRSATSRRTTPARSRRA